MSLLAQPSTTSVSAGVTDIPGAYQTLDDITAAYKAGHLEYYTPRDPRGKNVNAPDGKRILAAPMGRLTFAELQILGGKAWVAIKPTDIVRRLAGRTTPFALDWCGNRIYRIAYPNPLPTRELPPPVKPEAGTVTVNNDVNVPVQPVTEVVEQGGDTVVNNRITLPAASAPVVYRKGNVTVNNRIVVAPPQTQVGPPAPATVVRPLPPPIVAPSSDQMGPQAPRLQVPAPAPYQPQPYTPVVKKGWSTGTKILFGVGIAGGAYLLSKAFKKEDKNGPPSGDTLGEGGAPSGGLAAPLKMGSGDAALLRSMQGQAFRPGFNPAEFAAANGRGVYISIGRRF